MGNFREVSNCDKSTGLETWQKRDIKWKLALKVSHMRLSFETQFKIEFFTTVYRWLKNA